MTTYLPRSAWTTSGPAKPLAPMPSKPHGVAVHWPGTNRPIGSTSQANMAARLEGYRRFHVNGRGWNDIAYQVAIDQDGRVWELRGIDHESAANGDQSVNLTYLACLFMLGPGEEPGPALLAAFADWRRDRALKRYPSAIRVVGHRDIRPTGGTDCPGPITEALIKAGRLVTTAAPPDVPQEDDMPFTPDQLEQYAGVGVHQQQLGRSVLEDGKTPLTFGIAAERTYKAAAVLTAQVTALTAAVKALAAERGANGDQIEAIVEAAVKDSLKGMSITLSTGAAQ